MDAADVSRSVSTAREMPAASSPSRPASVCIVAHRAYGAITGGSSGHAGGVEHQTALTARWLASRGHDVQLIVWNEGSGREEQIAGVRVIKVCREADGIRGLRFFHPRWTTLNAALAAADADVYYHNCGEYVTGQVAMWCRRHGRRFIFSVASDPECDPALPVMHRRERLLYRYGLQRADRVITQTRRQQQMLRDGFGVDSTVLPMPCSGIPDVSPAAPPDRPARVVWVGRLSAEKRLEMLGDVAAILPGVRFEVIGPTGAETSGTDALRRALAYSNVTLRGRLGRAEMASAYRGATALLCTSSYEGFPNTFLESWGQGVPVVSTVNPDGLLTERGLGLTASDATGLAAHLRQLVESEPLWRGYAARARDYCVANHSVDRALPRFEAIFLDALKTPKARA